MIIFGTKTWISTVQQGQFHCPRCQMPRAFVHKKANRFFTLYFFIPVIPLGSAGEYVECLSCGGTFATEALAYDPQRDRAEAVASIARVIIAMMHVSGRTGELDIAAACDVLTKVSGDFVREDAVRQELAMVASASMDYDQFVRQATADFTPDGKKTVLQCAAAVLATDGELDDEDRGILLQLGAAMDIPNDTLQRMVA